MQAKSRTYPLRSHRCRGCNIAYDSIATANGEKSAEATSGQMVREEGLKQSQAEQCSGPADKERPAIMPSGESNNLLRRAGYMFLYDVYERMHIAIHYSIVSVTSRSVRLLLLTTRASMRISSSSVSLPFPLIIG